MTRFALYFYLVISFFTISTLSFASKIEQSKCCKATKSTMNNYEPNIFHPTNNLLKPTGEEAIYCGEKIIVSGILLDQNCNPVSNAKIYIWQANCNGKYPYEPLKNTVVDKKLIDQKNKGSFTGNGIATTNNNGEFHFITIYPPAMHGESSHINIRVEPYEESNMQTTLILKGKKIKNPILYPSLKNIAEIVDGSNIGIYNFEIVLPE